MPCIQRIELFPFMSGQCDFPFLALVFATTGERHQCDGYCGELLHYCAPI